MSDRATLSQKNKIISEHLPYEIDMFRYSYNGLRSSSYDQAKLNILIECFCMHARNLLDFFWDKERSNYAVARQFTIASYAPFGGASPKNGRAVRGIGDACKPQLRCNRRGSPWPGLSRPPTPMIADVVLPQDVDARHKAGQGAGGGKFLQTPPKQSAFRISPDSPARKREPRSPNA